MLSKFEILELLADSINQRCVPVAETYQDWLICGFVCASFGERGRLAYHKISATCREKYTEGATNRQFDACLKSAKCDENYAPLLTLCARYRLMLRDLLQQRRATPRTTTPKTNQYKEVGPINYELGGKGVSLILPYLADCTDSVRLAGVLAYLTGICSLFAYPAFEYDSRRQYLNTYFCCCAPAGSGKSIISDIRTLFAKVQADKMERTEMLARNYEETRKNTPAADRELLKPPPQFSFFLPANSSAAALLKTLSDNEGNGLMWEAELDTITRSFKSDYGNFSDAMRTNFHAETISYSRKQNREFVEINNPHFGIVVSGTPQQIPRFFGSAENGLFSRYVFCTLPEVDEWINKFHSKRQDGLQLELQEYIQTIANYAATVHYNVTFSPKIERRHQEYFSALQSDYREIMGDDAFPMVRRLGLISLRWAAALSILDVMLSGRVAQPDVVCSAQCFEFSLQLCEMAAEAGAQVIRYLPMAQGTTSKEAERERIFAALPQEFDITAMPTQLPQTTRYRWLANWVRQRKLIKDGEKWRKA